jgi:hypothetical protein
VEAAAKIFKIFYMGSAAGCIAAKDKEQGPLPFFVIIQTCPFKGKFSHLVNNPLRFENKSFLFPEG